jgi:hypothetical protein
MRSWILRIITCAILVLASSKAFPANGKSPADPCQSADVAKQSVPVSTTALSGYVEIIPASSQTIHVCGFLADGAFGFLYGPGVNCSGGATVLGNVFSAFGSQAHSYSGPGSIFTIPANNALCVSLSNTPVDGVVTYTQDLGK